jgi:hypothetical protein
LCFKNLTVFCFLFPLVADIWFELLVPEEATTERGEIGGFMGAKTN